MMVRISSWCDRYGKIVLFSGMLLAAFAVASAQQLSVALAGQDGENADQRPELIGQLVRLVNESRALADKGQFREAIEVARRLVTVERKLYGEAHETLALSLEWIADKQERLEDFDAAVETRKQILAMRKKLHGEKDWRVTNARVALENAQHLGRLSADERSALRRARQLNARTVELYRRGEYRRAIEAGNEVLEIRKNVLGEEHLHYAQSLHDLGFLHYRIGDYARAESLYQDALTIRKKVLGDGHPDYAASLNNLAFLHSSMGNYARARPLYEQAREIRRNVYGETHADYATSLNNLALLYQNMGDFARAEPLFQQALKIRKKVQGEAHPDFAASLNNLAALYWIMGDYARCRPLYEQALQIRKKVPGEEHPDYAVSLNGLAMLYESMGDYARAEPLYQQAGEIIRKSLGEAHPDYAASLNNLALLYQRMGDYARSQPLCQRALLLRKEVLGEAHPDYAVSLSNLALLYQRMGDYAQAEPLLRESLASTYKLLELTAAVQSERQQLAMLAQMRNMLDAYLSVALRVDLPREETYAFVLSWKGRVFLRQRQVRLARNEPALGDLFERLDETTSRLATLALATPTPQTREARDRQLRELSARKERLEAELSAKSAAFRQTLQPIGPDDLKPALPKRTVLVDFLEYTHFAPPQNGKGRFETERRLAAFVVRPQAPLVRVELGAVAPLSQAIDTWRQSYGRSEVARQAARQLRQRVWEPLEAHLADAEIVLLSPDGALGRFPLAALPGSEPDSYLLEERSLAVVPVPQALPALLRGERPKQVAGSLLAVGGVDYDANPAESTETAAPPRQVFGPRANRGVARGEGREKLTFLKGTAGEVAEIKELYSKYFGPRGLTLLEGAAAGEAAVRREAERHQYLHLATHGYFAPPELQTALQVSRSQPLPSGHQEFAVTGFHPGLLSGLALAGANLAPAETAEGYDGILAAEEVAALDLSGVDVAVLSACETGLGKTAGGEGLLGLQRAFQAAGAKTVVASLWQVNDAATRQIMIDFYDTLWQGEVPAAEALRQAQLKMLRGGAEVARGSEGRGLKLLDDHPPDKQGRLPPYYWAAFVLSGDWR